MFWLLKLNALGAVLMLFGVAAATAAERVLWEHQFAGQLWSSPQYEDGTLYFGCDDGAFYAFDVQAQDTAWSVQTGGRVRSAADITNHVVTFASDDGKLYALDQKTGAERWNFDLGGGLSARRLPATDAPYSYDYLCASPTYADGLVYAGSVNGQLFAIDHETGEERWRFATTEKIRSSPLVHEGNVYFGSWDGHLYALDADTGKLVWSFDCGGSIQSSPAVGAGKIIVGSRSAKIFAVDAQTGEQEWVYAHEDGSWVESSPVIDGAVVYVGSSDALAVMALDLASGEQIWRYETGGWSWGTPAVSGGTVYIGGMAAYPYYFEGVNLKAGFYAVDRETGEEKWQVVSKPIDGYVTGGVFARPVVADGVVYVCAIDGTLYALKE